MNEEKFIDISYPLTSDIVVYPKNPSFGIERVQDMYRGDSINVSRINMGSHTGTHVDAPSHFVQGGATLDQLSLDRFNGRAKVVDVIGLREIDKTLLCKMDIKKDLIILFKTDNSLKWNCDSVLNDYVTLTYEAAEYLAEKRIKMVGLDYMSIEVPRNKRASNKSIHGVLLESGVIICESLRLRDVCEGDYNVHCFPMNILGADGCPVRICLSSI